MKRKHFRVTSGTTVFVLSVLIACCNELVNAQPRVVRGYEAVQTGNASATHLDEFARVIGSISGGRAQAVVWINGIIHELPTPDGYEWAFEKGISPTTGIIVGGTHNPYGPIVWTIGHVQTLENLPGGECSAGSINDAGWAVGSCSWIERPALWKRSTIPIDLGDLGGGRAYAKDVNQRNEILGSSRRPGGRDNWPVIWKPNGEIVDLLENIDGEAWRDRAIASSINNYGEIVGELPDARIRGSWYWYNYQFVILPEPHACGYMYDAAAINDLGLVVGNGSDRDCGLRFRATIWERTSTRGQIPVLFSAYTIDEYLFRQPETRLYNANDINNAGQIAAFGELPGGEERGFLVTPYQFELSEPAPGVAGERNTITVTNLEPNQRVILVFGTKEGAQPIGNGCLGGVVLIRDATTHKSLEAFADQSGVATFNVFVPKATAGKTVRYQAIAPDECEISHTVEFTFQ